MTRPSPESNQAGRPRVEIVATGEEIRCGALIDSNSAWLAERLERLGLRVERITAVGDHEQALAELLEEISGRSRVALITGGLGPTPDDLSGQAAARAAGRPLVLDERGLAQVERFFAARGRPMPDSNRKQAMLPEGAELIENPLGTAPGFSLSLSGCRCYFLPGVPSEMKAMFTSSVAPDMAERLGSSCRPRQVVTLRTFGLTESGAAERLQGFETSFPGIELGYRASFPEIRISLSCADSEAKAGQSSLDKASAWVQSALGQAVFSTDGRPLEQVVGDQLRAEAAGLAVAESCTGGLISHLITSVAGSSEYFLLGAVTYANQSKARLLNVSPETLQEHGAVSEQTALEMARGVRRVGGADYGLATTGIAGPSGGSPDKPVGTVCIGLAGPETEQARRFTFRFERRSQNIRIFAVTGLDLLRRLLLQASAI
jgi:nicotinamide-nucleotide amidase